MGVTPLGSGYDKHGSSYSDSYGGGNKYSGKDKYGGGSSYDKYGDRDRNDYGSKSYGGGGYGGGSGKYDKNITAIGSSGEMVGPNGYVAGTRRLEEKQTMDKKILKTAAAIGSALAEKVPDALNSIKEEIAPSSGPSLPNTA